MKIRIEFDKNIKEDEIVITCKEVNNTIQNLQQVILDVLADNHRLSFYKEDKEYYLSLEDILYFETSDNVIHAHSVDNSYIVKYRLYELEKLLPNNFMRISKSTIINISQVFSISHNITSSSLVEFYKSQKKVYASRYYTKELRHRLNERRTYEKR